MPEQPTSDQNQPGKVDVTTEPENSVSPLPPVAGPAETAGAGAQVKLNPTGKPINMPVPLKANGRQLGEIAIRIDPDDSVLFPKAKLIEMLGKQLDKAALEKLQGIKDTAGLLDIATLKAAGFSVKFDAEQMELVFEASVDQRPVGNISLAGINHHNTESSQTVLPSTFSGYINLSGGLDQQWNMGGGQSLTGVSLGLESVFRLWNIVLENDFSYDSKVDLFKCPVGARCTVQHEAGWKRRSSRAVYDMPEHLLRFQFGDAAPISGSFQNAPDVLGFSVEHSPRKLAPNDSIRPTGRASFRIERAAKVDVMVNGTIRQRLQLAPGNYNLADLPLQAGANDIELVITDDSGESRTLSFKSFFDGSLLASGKSEWSLSAGIPSLVVDNSRVYRNNEVFGTGFLRYGLTDQLTGEVHAQGDGSVFMGGLGVFAALPYGFASLHGEVSTSNSGIGYAVGATYDLTNFAGLLHSLTGNRESIRLAADYRSAHYRTPGEFTSTASGIIVPEQSYSLRLSGAYSTQITDAIAASLAVRYQFGTDKSFVTSPYAVTGDRYGIDLTLSSSLSRTVSGSVNVGYSNDSYLRDFSNNQSDRGDFRVGVRFNIRPTANSTIAARYDSRDETATTSASWNQRNGMDRWDAAVDVGHYGYDDRGTAGGSVGYSGNRWVARVSHSAGADGVGLHSSDARLNSQRSSARLSTAIAFAGDKIAIGAPIRGNGFAIIDTHETIAGKALTVGDSDRPRAKSDWLGAALVNDVPAYAPVSLNVDVDDLPVGYSLGTGAFDIKAPYRGGYALEVGSSFSVSAFGTLLKADGKPVALLTGTATLEGNVKKQVPIFTNAAGKFGADGLGPGRWMVEMATPDKPTLFQVEIPKSADGLVQLGTLKPIKG